MPSRPNAADQAMSSRIRASEPFQIDVSQDVLDRILERVRAHRWPRLANGTGWQYGLEAAWFKEFVGYWGTAYRWRDREAQLNQFIHRIALIDGKRIHFVMEPGSGRSPQPLVLLHGWPYSFASLLPLAERLAHPERFGGDPEDGFDVVVPSLPGFIFSDAPDDRPRGLRFMSRFMHQLMTGVLGYQRYMIHGGDHGAVVADWLALDQPQAVLGIHLNMLAWRHAGAAYGSGQIGVADPSPAEQAFVQQEVVRMDQESAYFQLQSTRPETIAYAMSDSPVGLAAYVLDKWQKWTDTRQRSFEEIHDRDALLDNLMLYLVTGSFATSLWPYAGFALEPFGLAPGQTINVPTGYSMFEDPLLPRPPRRFVERSHPQIVLWRDHLQGGHFPFLETPDLLAADIHAFRRSL